MNLNASQTGRGIWIAVLSIVLIGTVPIVRAQVNTWTGNGQNWNDGAHWSSGVPAAGQDVVIAGNIVLTNSPAALASYTLNAGATNTFDGWSTILEADTITIYGVITQNPNTDTNGTAGDDASWTPDNRVYLMCSNLIVAADGQIDANGKGYGSPTSAVAGVWAYGPGAATGANSGGGYGGRGGDRGTATGGATYGSPTAPIDPGSGGARHAFGQENKPGSHGGGALRIEASGHVLINGAITADGGLDYSTHADQYRGAGSGGSIYMICNTLAATNGIVRAAGGIVTGGSTGCGGGGGRIAFEINDRASQAALPVPVLNVSARAGWLHDFVVGKAFPGTIHWNAHPLVLTSSPGGATDTATGWHTNLAEVAIQALPDGDYSFQQWSGAGVPEGAWTNNPLTVTMDRVRAIQANFVSDTPVARAWTGGAGAWFDPAKWDPAGIPGPADSVSIPTGSLSLSEPTAVGALTLGNATLTVSNWYTRLTVAGDVTILNGGTLSLPAAFRSTDWPESPDVPLSNRIELVCANLTIDNGGKIDAAAKGYYGDHTLTLGGYGSRMPPGGTGAGAAGNPPGGASHGGRGAIRAADEIRRAAVPAGPIYGSPQEPALPGSGGQTSSGTPFGGHGGGVIKIAAISNVTVNGTIAADGGLANNGANNHYGGGGSGGSVWIVCEKIEGNGSITAGGADCGLWWAGGAGGGGGRIAVHYDPAAQRLIPPPRLRLRNKAGISSGNNTGNFLQYRDDAQMGTIYLTDDALLRDPLTPFIQGRLTMGGVMALAYDHLTISNALIAFDPGFRLTVSNTLTVLPGSETIRIGQYEYEPIGVRFAVPDGELDIGGHVVITNNARLHVYAGPTNGSGVAYGGQLNVAGDIRLFDGALLRPHADPTNGAPVRIRAANLAVDSGAAIDATGLGYVDNRGPGRGNVLAAGGVYQNSDSAILGGGGYGGQGGRATEDQAFGDIHGDPFMPLQPGGGGGGNAARYGGGMIWLEVAGRLTIDGEVRADGIAATIHNNATSGHGGAGAAGGIYLRCRRLLGAGAITALGGDTVRPDRAAGGGGRIAVWRVFDAFDRANVSAVGGVAESGGLYNGGDGTVVFVDRPPAGMLFLVK